MQGIRAVFDCNVLLQAMANANGPAGVCYGAVRKKLITLCLSHSLKAELKDVLARPLIISKLRLTDAGITNFLTELHALALLVEPVPPLYQHPSDPKDSMVVDLAIAAAAHVITSRDRHLLSLRDASTPSGADFISRFGFIDVLTPVELLERLRGDS